MNRKIQNKEDILMSSNDSNFLRVIENMKNTGYLSELDAENLRLKYMDYLQEDTSLVHPMAGKRKYMPVKAEEQKPVTVKEAPAKDYIRERNLTWILNTGCRFNTDFRYDLRHHLMG